MRNTYTHKGRRVRLQMFLIFKHSRCCLKLWKFWDKGKIWSLLCGLLNTKEFFVSISTPIQGGQPVRHIWKSLCMRCNQRRFGRNWSSIEGTLLVNKKQFFVFIWAPIQAGHPIRHFWKPLPMHCSQWRFGLSLVEVYLLWRNPLLYHP
jgi:hypothetical protein